jgi:hypothetical protein
MNPAVAACQDQPFAAMAKQPNNCKPPRREAFKIGALAHDGACLDSAVTLSAVIPNDRFAVFSNQRSARMLVSSRSALNLIMKIVFVVCSVALSFDMT